jgi:hypothetical protein
VQATAEAYVVPNMTVNVLLGKDFQLNYGINVNHSPNWPSTILFANQDTTIAVLPVGLCCDSKRIERSGMSIQSFVKAASHRQIKSTRQQLRSNYLKRAVCTVILCIVKPQSVIWLPVTAKLGDNPEKQWFVD